ncbi:MAG: heparan-alpha-glucosaminide N-acetyltransferase domain-containing protein [Acidobacteriota bacterium]|nr:heparan-alpha-glucosaminide N-acetyltransferase domain-containing protein [Acidobacteriota bacterium]
MKPAPQRLLYLDWVRGLAALVMLQGHVFNSFTRTDLREGGPYMMSQFLGGMPPAIFLFLLGVTFAFLMDSQQRKGVAPAWRWLASMKRSGYLFAAAFAFRLQLWLFSIDQNSWKTLFRVDILNCMGLALLILSVMAIFRTEERIRLCAILGVAIASASPLISGIDWSGSPELLRDYIVPDHVLFGFFPWAAFAAFGMSAGSVLRILKPDEVPTVMQWLGWGGVTVAFSAWTVSGMSLSIYSNSDFWLNSPALVLIKLGAIMILIAFAWVWNFRVAAQQWSWVRQFGLTSLLVYWVHIELVYGRWFGFLKEQLSVGQTILASVATILLMLGLSLLRTNWAQVRNYFAPANASLGRRVSGD